MNSIIVGILAAAGILMLLALAHDTGYITAMLDHATGNDWEHIIFSYDGINK